MTELECRDLAATRQAEQERAREERGGVAYTLLHRKVAAAKKTEDNGEAKNSEAVKEENAEVGEDESFEAFAERVKTGAHVKDQSLTESTVSLWSEWMLNLQLTFPEESIQPIFSGGCWAGTVVWPAALLLCEYIHKHVDVKDKRVLELGSGLGVPGMACQLMGAREVILTEQEPLPDLLRRNVEINFPEKEGDNKTARPIVDTLDWEEPEESSTNAQEPFDVILISDCVYQELYGDSWRALADCIRALSRANKATMTYNALERRRADGVHEFLQYCTEIGVKYNRVLTYAGPENEDLEIYEMWTEE